MNSVEGVAQAGKSRNRGNRWWGCAVGQGDRSCDGKAGKKK